MNNTQLDTVSAYLQGEVRGPDLVAEIPRGVDNTTSIFVARMDTCVASRIDTHASVSVFQSKKREVRLKTSD